MVSTTNAADALCCPNAHGWTPQLHLSRVHERTWLHLRFSLHETSTETHLLAHPSFVLQQLQTTCSATRVHDAQ